MNRLLLRWGPPLGIGYLRLVGAATRYVRRHEEPALAARAEAGSALCAVWHNRLLGPVIPYRDRGAGVAISLSDDGELISRVVSAFGYVPLRGSTSRGGSRVLRAMLAHLDAGHDVVFTPDGPRGPRYTVQPGVALLARRTGLPVVPIGVGMTRKLVFSSWDRFQMPLPFGTICIYFAEPLRFGPKEEVALIQDRIRHALIAATRAADETLGVTSP